MTEKELEALRRGNVKQGDQVAQAKNTVLVLPKIQQRPALVRLGKMHTGQGRADRSMDPALPPSMLRPRQPPGDIHGFVPAINLPMKSVYLNPFPSAIDALHPRLA